jgi:hypothetical protein
MTGKTVGPPGWRDTGCTKRGASRVGGPAPAGLAHADHSTGGNQEVDELIDVVPSGRRHHDLAR